MKKLLFILLCLPLCLQAQECHSWDGDGLKPNAKIRTLNLFINIIYDVHPDTNPCRNDTTVWKNAFHEGINNEAIPSYLLDTSFMNTVYVPGHLTGCLTRVYGESSFDTLQLTGDFVVVNIKESRILQTYGCEFDRDFIPKCAVRYINDCGGLQTIYHHDSISDYEVSNNRQIWFVQSLIRNISYLYGKMNAGSGHSNSCFNQDTGCYSVVGCDVLYPHSDSLRMGNKYYFLGRNGTVQCVGNTDLGKNPTSIVCHEISHQLFGGNEFHTSGGNHRYKGDCSQMPFLNIQDGYGLMGCANSSLVGCNGYERLRMHWKHPDAPDYITARDSTNSSHVLSNISRADGNRTFRLRDFVTYGDAVRIRLPYTDSSVCSNQYIWLENHKIGQNGKLDFLQYSNVGQSCRPAGASGIYAYYQIGRDQLTGIDTMVWFKNERDNLRQIPAEGFYDFTLIQLDSSHAYNLECVNFNPHYYYHVQGAENPFNGYSDLEDQFNPDAGDDTLRLWHEYPLWRKVVGQNTLDGLVNLGDNADAFSCYSHVNMGTNPSTCNAKVYYNCLREDSSSDYVSNRNNPRNVRHTWLSGLGITMEPLPDGDFLVRVRWDDYDITNDAIWTGRVMLREEANLTRGHIITLTQNRTPEQPFRDSVSGEFAPVSRLRCLPGSVFRMGPQSSLLLENKSSVLLDSGSTLSVGDSAEVHVGAGCIFEASRYANLRLGRHARIVVEEGGTLVLRNRSRFNRNAHIRVLPGGRLIAAGATLTGDGDGMWAGIVVEGNPNSPRTGQYQGSVRLEDCVVSHAECALSIGDHVFSTTTTRDGMLPEFSIMGGGIVRAVRTMFRDNIRAVFFAPYERQQSVYEMEALSKSCFRECEFTLDDSIRFPGTEFNAHVRLEGVRDPLFLGCQFSDGRHGGAANTFGIGISAYRSGMVVDRYETTPGNHVESIFSNFRTAIMMENNVERFTAVRHTAFQNNLVGIHALATMYMVCVGNSFQISNPIPQTVGNAYGLLLEQSGGAVVRDNDFFSGNLPGTAGVLVRSSGAEAWSIRNNSFHQLCAGVLVSGCNADLSSDTASCGLTACCNEFRNNGSSLHIMEESSLALAQGASGHAAGNLFMNSTADIRKLNTQKMVYYYNGNGTNHRPDRIYGDVGNVTVLQTFSDDCDGAYGISPDNPLSGVYTGVSLPDLGQRFIELRQEYVESQEGYEGMYPGSGMTSGTLVGQAQRNAFALMQWRRQQLSDICAEAVLHIISDTVFDRQAYVQWLGNSRSPRAAYALLEDAYVNDPVTFNQLALSIPDDYASLDAGEYSSLLQLYAVRKPADSLGCGWANLDGNAVAVLENVAGRDDYAGAVAKSVLDNHYGEAYLYNNQHPAWPYELDCMLRRDSTTADSTDIDTTGHKLMMTFTDNDSLSDTMPQRTSYMSFFGKNRTVWSFTFPIIDVYWNNFIEILSDSGMESAPFDVENLKNNLDFFSNREQQCACFSETDTVNYTVLANPESSGTLQLSLRVDILRLKNVTDTFTYNGHSYTSISGEDTVNGRLYRLYYDSIEVLWCDMSLTLGDTFRLPDLNAIAHHNDDWEYMGQGSYWIVDSVYYLDNRKIIRFELVQGKSPWWYRKLPLYFIEGIGPTYGPFGKLWEDYTMEYGPELPLLLCVYKDDTLDFMTSSAWGCNKNAGPGWYFEDDAVKEPKRTTLTLQPNPAQDYILLRNEDASDLGGEIIITDAIGRVLLHRTMEQAEMRINTSRYSSGTYFVRYRSKNGVQILKFVKAE